MYEILQLKRQSTPQTDTSGVRLGSGLFLILGGTQLPQDKGIDIAALCPIAFAIKSLTSTETGYSNIEREALSILHGLRSFTTTDFPTRSV